MPRRRRRSYCIARLSPAKGIKAVGAQGGVLFNQPGGGSSASFGLADGGALRRRRMLFLPIWIGYDFEGEVFC
jgi:hypothetical protein